MIYDVGINLSYQRFDSEAIAIIEREIVLKIVVKKFTAPSVFYFLIYVLISVILFNAMQPTDANMVFYSALKIYK